VKTRAAVLWSVGEPVEIVDADLEEPREGEVLVKVAACGVCASDLHVVDGDLVEPLPIVLGHEASGVVVETGPRVARVANDDHVVLVLAPSCGRCTACRAGNPNFCQRGGQNAAEGTLSDGTSRLSVNGTRLNHFNSVSTFAEYAVVPESAAIPVRGDVPLRSLALVGCAVLTGYGAVVRTAGVRPGSSVAVWGCGGVGLNIVQTARLVGGGTVVAVDVSQEKLMTAERLGATHLVEARDDPVTAVREATNGGPDYAFEAVGREESIRQAWDVTRAGGTVVVVGMMPRGSTLTIDPWWFVYEKTLKGCFLGSARLPIDVPRIVGHYAAGRLALDELVDREIGLDELPAAFARMRAGEGLRQLVVFD
jgi:S-(hydroxymethyl)glutathione dehydrogenase / alcohol dehydrogenase